MLDINSPNGLLDDMAKDRANRDVPIIGRARAGSFILRGTAHGLAQMGSFGTARPVAKFPKGGQEAIHGDWKRLGKDMKRAIGKVRERG